MNPELVYSHNRDMLLVLVRRLPDHKERFEAESRLMAMQEAFDRLQAAQAQP